MSTHPKPTLKTRFDQIMQGEVMVSHKAFSLDEIKAFCLLYDRQDMHIDEEKAKETRFGGLIGSGWQTATVAIDLLVQEHVNTPGGMLGMGVDQLRWLKPIWPDEMLTFRYTVLEKRLSKSLAGDGIVVFQIDVDNPKGECVMKMTVPTILSAK